MNELVKGKNVTVFKWDTVEELWVPYACARSNSLSIDISSIETSITGAGKFRTFIPQATTFTGTIEGLTELMKVNHVSVADLTASAMAHEIFLMRFEDISDGGDVFTKEASFFITNVTQTASFDNVATFSVALQGTGPLTLVYEPTPIIEGEIMRTEFVLLATETTVTVSEAIGGMPKSIVLDGYDWPVIILSGIPIGSEVKFTAGTGVITFPIADADNDRPGYILYQL